MTATSDLRDEHKGVLRMLDILDSMAGEVEAGGIVPQHDLAEASEFLRVFVDQCHHGKEEGVLFPAMRAPGFRAQAPVIRRLTDEHDMGRAAASRIQEVSLRWGSAASSDPDDLVTAIRNYTPLLRAHIDVEETQCFDAADRGLPSDVVSELQAAYDTIEREVVGEGRHEQFHAMLDRMAETYLAQGVGRQAAGSGRSGGA